MILGYYSINIPEKLLNMKKYAHWGFEMHEMSALQELKVEDVMSGITVMSSVNEKLSNTLGKMKKNDASEIPVIERGKLVGMVSYDTLIKRRQLPLNADIHKVLVKPPKVSPEDDLRSVAEILLINNYRAVPVVKKGKPVGMVSRMSIIKSLSKIKIIRNIPTEEIMTPTPQVVHEKDRMEKARHLMRVLDCRAVPVVNDRGELVGVVGIKDIIRFLENLRKQEKSSRIMDDRVPVAIEVKSLMRSPPVHVDKTSKLGEVLDKMIDNNISTVFVTESMKVVGVVMQSDILEHIISGAEEGMYVQITGLEDEDPNTYDILYSIIEKSIKKITHLCTPQTLTIHISVYHKEGDTFKYSLNGRLITDKGLVSASAYDWDLYACTTKMLEKMEKQIKRTRERRKKKRFPMEG